MAQEQLRIAIIEIADLMNKDKRDLNELYVEIYLNEKEKQKTRTIMNEKRLKWNQTFDFDLLSSNKYLYINVYNEDDEKKSSLIGSTNINLDKVIKTGHFDDWIQLSGLFGFGNRGDIHIRMTFEKTSSL